MPTAAAHPAGSVASPRIFRSDRKASAAHHPAGTNSVLLSPASSASLPSDYEFDASGPQEVHRVPSDQLAGLSEEQKQEVFTKILSALNPQAARALTRFDYAEGGYKAVGSQSQLAVHFVLDGLLVHTDSDDAKEQKDWLALNKDRLVELKSAGTDTNEEREGGASATPPLSPSARNRDEDDDQQAATAVGNGVNDKALKNQFNYSERGNQTVNGSMRDREVVTEPPPCLDFSGQVTHWEIFDSYCDALEKEMSQREAKEKPKKKHNDEDEEAGHTADTAESGGTVAAQSSSFSSSSSSSSLSALNDRILFSPSCLLALKTMERVINQNAESAAFHDYKYRAEDSELAAPLPPPLPPTSKKAASHLSPPSSLVPKGPFIPLWKFSHPEAKNLTVTSITFNPHFPDLFAVSYGSFDFGHLNSKRGLVCIFTLKNVGWPEFILRPSSAVMSLDFHLDHPALLVCGLYDGNVCVFDVRSKGGEALYSSDDPKLKHSDCVWQVRWSRDNSQQPPLHFFSVSADGRVSDWRMKKNELQVEDVIKLTPSATAVSTSATASSSPSSSSASPSDDVVVTAGGSCFDFNSHFPHLFLVGTEEGGISLYNKAYNAQLVRTFLGHHMSIYTLTFSPFHPGVFLSASADWQLKLWEIDSEAPVMTFDLNCSVGDVCWSPYSSSAFAVVTSDGRLRVFDLSLNKHDCVGEMKVGKKSRLTKVRWSGSESILCLGDDRGVVSVVKVVMGRKAAVKGAVDLLEEVRRLDRLLILKNREDGRQPDYLRHFIAAEEKKREGNEKARLADKMAADKAKTAATAGANGGTSPVGSPKGKPSASPRGE